MYARLMRRIITAGIIGVILAAALLVRIQNLGAIRPFEEDERSWLLLGTSLLRTGVPECWTIYWNRYSHLENINLGGVVHLVAVPYLDHPPVFGLGMGIWTKIIGNDTSERLDWDKLRWPMIGVSMVTIGATTLLAHKLWGRRMAGITLLAASFFPSQVIAARFIAAENLIAALLMVCLYAFAVIDIGTQKNKWLTRLAMTVIGIISGGAILLKLSGIVIPASIGLLALMRKKWRVFGITAAATLMSIGILTAYAAHYDWGLFVSLLQEHTGRPQSFWNFWAIVTQMDLGYFSFRDPAIIIGFIGLFLLLANTKIARDKRAYILAPVLCFSLLFLWVAPTEAYGWYRYAIFPILAIGLGYTLTEFMNGKVMYYILFLPAIAMMLEQSQALGSHGEQRVFILELYIWAVIAVLLKYYGVKLKVVELLISRTTVVFWFVLQILWASRTIWLAS